MAASHMRGHNWVGESPSGFCGWTREMSEVPPPFIQSVGTESEAHGLLEVRCSMKRAQHGASAGADAVSCRPADRVIPWGRSSVPIIIKLVLELGLLFVCLQIGFSSASSTPPTLSASLPMARTKQTQRKITTTTSASTPPTGPATPLDGGLFLRSLEAVVEGVVHDLYRAAPTMVVNTLAVRRGVAAQWGVDVSATASLGGVIRPMARGAWQELLPLTSPLPRRRRPAGRC